MADIALWIFGGVVSIWLLASPLICLYWAYRPAEGFWWKHRCLTWVIGIGGFLFCFIAIAQMARSLLWFIPDGWTYKTEEGEIKVVKWSVASIVGFYASFALTHLLTTIGGEKCKKKREESVEWRIARIRRKLNTEDKRERERAIARLKEEERELETLEWEEKIAPWQEDELAALRQVLSQIDEEEGGDDDLFTAPES